MTLPRPPEPEDAEPEVAAGRGEEAAPGRCAALVERAVALRPLAAGACGSNDCRGAPNAPETSSFTSACKSGSERSGRHSSKPSRHTSESSRTRPWLYFDRSSV